MTAVPADVRERAERAAAEHLDWLGQVMLTEGDLTGALLAALILRHLLPHGDPARQSGFSPASLYGQLGGIARRAFADIVDGDSVVAPFDAILADLKRRTQGSQ